MHLAGEVQFSGWSMGVDRDELAAAISAGRAGARVGQMVLVVCEGGLSVRSRTGSAGIAGRGFWASPVAVEAGRLRQAVGRAAPLYVQIEYARGRLILNGQSLPAREL